MNKDLKILVWDIETSQMLVPVFSLWGNDSIQPDNILQEWFIISAAWKWLGHKKVSAVSLLDDSARFKNDHLDDYHVVATMHEVLSEADVILGHNIDRFDWPKLNTRFIKHGLPPLPKKQHIDTLKIAKKEFKFSSNRLDYIAKFLGIGRKIETAKGLWLAALMGDKKAIRQMVTYNKGDVELTEKVYLALRPYSRSNVNLSAFTKGDHACPKCTSTEVHKRGYAYTGAGKYQRYQCTNCGGWSRGKDNLLSKKHSSKTLSESLLTNQ